MLPRFFRETAGGAGLQFEGEFPPQIEEVHDGAILPEQGSMNSLQSRNRHAHNAFNRAFGSSKSVFLHGVTP
jgi:hypothetical protein